MSSHAPAPAARTVPVPSSSPTSATQRRGLAPLTLGAIIASPAVNWALLAAVMAAAMHFGGSSARACAYGIAVTLTMMITTVLTYFVVRESWRVPRPWA